MFASTPSPLQRGLWMTLRSLPCPAHLWQSSQLLGDVEVSRDIPLWGFVGTRKLLWSMKHMLSFYWLLGIFQWSDAGIICCQLRIWMECGRLDKSFNSVLDFIFIERDICPFPVLLTCFHRTTFSPFFFLEEPSSALSNQLSAYMIYSWSLVLQDVNGP